MRRLWISLAALSALFCLTLCNSYYLKNYTQGLSQLLTEAEICVTLDDWDAAADKTEAALDRWKSRETCLHMILQHRDTDEVLLSFQEVRQLIAHQEHGGEYSAANARLITQIGLLSEMEELNLKNIL